MTKTKVSSLLSFAKWNVFQSLPKQGMRKTDYGSSRNSTEDGSNIRKNF